MEAIVSAAIVSCNATAKVGVDWKTASDRVDGTVIDRAVTKIMRSNSAGRVAVERAIVVRVVTLVGRIDRPVADSVVTCSAGTIRIGSDRVRGTGRGRPFGTSVMGAGGRRPLAASVIRARGIRGRPTAPSPIASRALGAGQIVQRHVFDAIR